MSERRQQTSITGMTSVPSVLSENNSAHSVTLCSCLRLIQSSIFLKGGQALYKCSSISCDLVVFAGPRADCLAQVRRRRVQASEVPEADKDFEGTWMALGLRFLADKQIHEVPDMLRQAQAR